MPTRLARCATFSLLAACTAPTTDAPPPAARDSAGLRIVEVTKLGERRLSTWTVASEPTVVIGRDDARQGHDLFGVRGAGVLSDGRIVVGDGTTSQLRIFSREGVLVSTLGRKGSGPGEFQGLLWLHAGPGDSIRAYDYNLRRMSVFSAAGALARSYTVTPPTDAGYPEPKGALADGSIVFVPGFDRRFGTGERRDTVPFFLYDADGALVRTIASFPGREEFFGRSGEASVRSEVPFGRDVLVATGGDAIVIGTTDAYALSMFDARGVLQQMIRAEVSPVAVDVRAVDAWKRRKLERMPEQMRERFAGFYEDLPVRETQPAFSALLVDEAGMLWVKRADAEDGARGTWEVFAPSGEPVARARMPHDIEVLEIGTRYVLARSLDADGNELVLLYALQRT